jgi:uncharacterized protein (TIGR02145 family)
MSKIRNLVLAGIAVLLFACEPQPGVTPEPGTSVNPYLNPNLTYGSVTDIDSNQYATIKIGTQTWMAENLKTTRYNDGTPIPDKTNEKLDTTGAYMGYDSPENDTIYGKLYNWNAVKTGKLCPKGWHIPTDAEWTQLETYLGDNAGGKMKATGPTSDSSGLWISPNTDATNESGFTGLPGGSRSDDGSFSAIGLEGEWWSATEPKAPFFLMRSLSLKNSDGSLTGVNYLDLSGVGKGYSCRCVQD